MNFVTETEIPPAYQAFWQVAGQDLSVNRSSNLKASVLPSDLKLPIGADVICSLEHLGTARKHDWIACAWIEFAILIANTQLSLRRRVQPTMTFSGRRVADHTAEHSASRQNGSASEARARFLRTKILIAGPIASGGRPIVGVRLRTQEPAVAVVHVIFPLRFAGLIGSIVCAVSACCSPTNRALSLYNNELSVGRAQTKRTKYQQHESEDAYQPKNAINHHSHLQTSSQISQSRRFVTPKHWLAMPYETAEPGRPPSHCSTCGRRR